MGINFSDLVTTVSGTYARKILTPEVGYGFDAEVVGARRDRLLGILNGIDTDAWNPARDPLISKPLTPADVSGKRASKR